MWMAFAGTEPLQDSIHEDDPGMCMLYLMQHYPYEVGRDFLSWADMRDERTETMIRALFDPVIAGALKEEYLDFVSICTLEVGYYNMMYSNFSIRTDETEGEE